MSFENIESYIEKFPVYQFEFIHPDDIEYSEKVRQLCKRTCPNYAGSWSCPPAIGKIERCKKTCLNYTDVLVFSTVTEIKSESEKETASAQKEHEKLTRILSDYMLSQGYVTYVVSSGKCRNCARCTFPRDFCRHPDEMYPCIESHGIVISDLMEMCDMDYYLGSRLYLLFTLIYFKETDVRI